MTGRAPAAVPGTPASESETTAGAGSTSSTDGRDASNDSTGSRPPEAAEPAGRGDSAGQQSEDSSPTSRKAAVALPEDERYVAEEAPDFSADDGHDSYRSHGNSSSGPVEAGRAVAADSFATASSSSDPAGDDASGNDPATYDAAGTSTAGTSTAGTNAATYDASTNDAAAQSISTRASPEAAADAQHSAVIGDPAVAMLMEVFPGRILSISPQGDDGDRAADGDGDGDGADELRATAAGEDTGEESDE